MDMNPGTGAARRADAVAQAVADDVSRGLLLPGARLPTERALMLAHGVSRAVAREAVALLAAQGLVRLRPGHRPVVQKPGFDAVMGALAGLAGQLVHDAAGAASLFETRILVECALARQAARHARPEDLHRLDAALQANGEAIGDAARFYATDVAFHGALYAVPRNPIWPALHQAYVQWLTAHWRRMPAGEALDRTAWSAHAAIRDAVHARDADAAEDAVRRHLLTAWELVRPTLPMG